MTPLVKEEYISYQGTGLLLGTKQYFVRLAGCSVKCPLRKKCDQQDALSYSGYPLNKDLVFEMAKKIGWLHITGGEPLEYDLSFVDEALEQGIKVQIQTSGSLPKRWYFSPFVSVSPKQKFTLITPSEIILVASRWLSNEFALKFIHHKCPIFVIPESGQSSKRACELVELLIEHNVDARLNIQAHLFWDLK